MSTPTGPFVDADGTTLTPTGTPLRAAVLSVGSELLLGDLTDTNAPWLSNRLRELGIDVRHHLAVRDDIDEFVTALRWLGEHVQVVIIGGGLGPTSDDLTREAVAAAAEVDLEHRDDLEEDIRQRFAAMDRRMPEQNLRQARVPRGATVFAPVGTAPGFATTIAAGGTATRVYAVPGVPWELQELWSRDLAPELLALAGTGATLTRLIHVVGKGESDVAEIVELLVADLEGVTLSFLAKSHEIQVRLTVTADDAETAREDSQPLIEELIGALGSAVAGLDEETLEDVVVRMLGDTGTTLGTAESATAGDIAARIGKVPGASHGLRGGVVVYATDLKEQLLGVDPALLEDPGPVSREVTVALAEGVRERLDVDWGLAVTASAGPTEQNGQPVGTSFWALAHPDGHVEVHGRRIPGDRGQVIARLGSVALDLLRRRLSERR